MLEFAISQDDGEGGMHVSALLKMALAFETVENGGSGFDGVVVVIIVLFLCDCTDARERAGVSAGPSWISGILHVRAKNITCVNGKIRQMLFLDRSRRAASFTTKNFC